MVPELSRRSVLGATATTVMGGLAGCQISKGDGSKKNKKTTTAATKSGFDFVLRNKIGRSDLQQYPAIDGTPPAEISLRVEAQSQDGSETDVFERSLDVPPDKQTRIADAFTPKADGTNYVVAAELGKFPKRGRVGHTANFHSAGYRFTPGGASELPGTTLLVTVEETQPDPQFFKPKIAITLTDGA